MNIEREAIKFSKNFKKEPTFVELKNYLENNLHYKLLFFDTTIAKKEIEFLKLKVPKKEKGLTVNVSEGQASLCLCDQICLTTIKSIVYSTKSDTLC